MQKSDLNRVVFHSVEDMARGHQLRKGEPTLRQKFDEIPNDVNDILELFNIKLFIDARIYLNDWSNEDIEIYRHEVVKYGEAIGQFMAKLNDDNILGLHDQLIFEYIESFWKLVDNHKVFKRISPNLIEQILVKEPHQIRAILRHEAIVKWFSEVIREFLLSYPQSAELLIEKYEVRRDFSDVPKYFPKCLSIQDKEVIISDYINSESCNLNYLPLIQNSKKSKELIVSDKTRLMAKRRYEEETRKLFEETPTNSMIYYEVSIDYPEKASKLKDCKIENLIVNYSYSLDYIKAQSHPHAQYLIFKLLFEYIDNQNRICLVSRPSQMGVMERLMGIRAKTEYTYGMVFRLSEMASQAQILSYAKILKSLNTSLESVLSYVYTSVFAEKYDFANNATLNMPTQSASALEKVRSLAPELESVLKQYKLFVEDNQIDYDLIQMSSSPCTIKDVTSLNKGKYLYLNTENQEANTFSNLFFSDQTLLAYVEPYKEKHYSTFFDLIKNETVIDIRNYEEHQKPKLDYLIKKGLISVDEQHHVQVPNHLRIWILKDLYENSVGSFYHYPASLKEEAVRMESENLIYFESSLFSKPEQNYFNYYLNKSEFTNGLDLRNSYLHGSQASSIETDIHEQSYFMYLKLLTLLMLKIEDDLLISKIAGKGVESLN